MKILKVIACVFLLPIMGYTQAITFTKYYDYGQEAAYNILELNDGYLMATMVGQPALPRKVYIIKTDFYGDTLWVKYYGNSTDQLSINSLIRTYDGNYIVGTDNKDYNIFRKYSFLLKIDSNGDSLWLKKIYPPGSDRYNSQFVIECTDHGFLITGQQVDSLITDGDALIIKTDSLGNYQWSKTFGGPLFDAALSSVELPDKSFLTLGWTRSFSFGNRDLYLIKTDSLGNLIWQKHYGTTFLDGGTGITKTSDGNYLLAGYKGNSSTGLVDAWLLKIDTSGSILWQKTLTNSGEAEIWWARELVDGTIVGAGSKSNPSFTLDSAWIVKTDGLGNKLWERGFVSNNNYSYFRDVQPTSDGGFACVGFVFTGPSGNEDGWLIKLDSMGCDSSGCATYTGVGINEINNEGEFSLYPNPVTDLLTIRFSYSLFSVCDISVYNMLGEQVYTTKTFVQKQTVIPVSQLPPGMYFLSLKYEGQTVAKKFVKR